MGAKAHYSPEQLRRMEGDVLLLVATGLLDREIAEELNITMSQVVKCNQRLMSKYMARNRAHVVAEAYHNGDLIPRRQNGPDATR